MHEERVEMVRVRVKVVPLSELHTGPVVMGGELCRVVVIDRAKSGGAVLKVMTPNGTETQTYGSPATPFLVLNEGAVS
jgi:hypothetical protein